MNVALKIINSGNQKGTVGWLAKNAASIKVGYHGNYLAAWLLDHHGKVITYLTNRVEDDILLDPSFRYEWTPAAQDALKEMVEIAQELLETADEDHGKVQWSVMAKTA